MPLYDDEKFCKYHAYATVRQAIKVFTQLMRQQGWNNLTGQTTKVTFLEDQIALAYAGCGSYNLSKIRENETQYFMVLLMLTGQ